MFFQDVSTAAQISLQTSAYCRGTDATPGRKVSGVKPQLVAFALVRPLFHPQHEGRHALHAAFAPILSRGQKGEPHREPAFLSSYSAGTASHDQRVAAVLQHRLHPTMSRGRWRCRCCCCCCRCCCYCCCYCHAAASCRCMWLARRCCSGPPAKTRYRDQRGGWTPPSCRRYCPSSCHQRTQLLT